MPPHFSFRLTVAFIFSLVLHGSLAISDAFRRSEVPLPPSPPALLAVLRPPEPELPAESPPESAPSELLLKNTLDTEGAAENPEPSTPIEEAKPEPEPEPTPPPAPAPRVEPPPPVKKPPVERPRPPRPQASEPRKKADPPQSAPPANRPPLAAVQRKLSEFVFYPEAARSQGIEGTVYLFIQLGPDCTVEDVSIDGSSGSRLLDKAAEKGAWAVHKLPGCRSGIYPYVFRLID